MQKASYLFKPRVLFLWLLLASLIIILLSAASVSAAPESGCGGYHWVARGETLSGISQKYGVGKVAILRANPRIQNPDRIYAGTYLHIPCGGGKGQPGTGGMCQANHFVKRGETLSKIGYHYRTAPYAIARANNIANVDLIYSGQTLCIP